MRDVVIVGAARTAVGLENKSLKDVPPETLGAIVMKDHRRMKLKKIL